MTTVFDLVRKTRSVRRFRESAEVSMETLEYLVDLARCTASAANKQPLKYVLCSDRETNATVFSRLAWAACLPDWPGPAARRTRGRGTPRKLCGHLPGHGDQRSCGLRPRHSSADHGPGCSGNRPGLLHFGICPAGEAHAGLEHPRKHAHPPGSGPGRACRGVSAGTPGTGWLHQVLS